MTVLACFGLAACGFEPLYGEQETGPSAEDVLGYVRVAPIADRVGQLVRIELENRMFTTDTPRPVYTLKVELTESKKNLAVRRDASATRANLTLSASFELNRIVDNVRVMGGGVRSVSGYDILTSDFATFAAETDARKRAARDIADGIVERLAIFLSRPENQPAGLTAR